MSEKLYKGKYLITLYDKNELPIAVCGSAKEFCRAYNASRGLRLDSETVMTQISRAYVHKKPNSEGNIMVSRFVWLVRVDNVEKDCFEEEDKEFKNLYSKKNKTVKEIAKELGMSEREYYRRKGAFKNGKRK